MIEVVIDRDGAPSKRRITPSGQLTRTAFPTSSAATVGAKKR